MYLVQIGYINPLPAKCRYKGRECTELHGRGRKTHVAFPHPLTWTKFLQEERRDEEEGFRAKRNPSTTTTICADAPRVRSRQHHRDDPLPHLAVGAVVVARHLAVPVPGSDDGRRPHVRPQRRPHDDGEGAKGRRQDEFGILPQQREWELLLYYVLHNTTQLMIITSAQAVLSSPMPDGQVGAISLHD